ncbi:MAG TPA: hypothetical protein QGF41_13620 [Gammaproteobacteria bacterium]|nr:hypothetical protein [Gammaproteobacteria bacterium]
MFFLSAVASVLTLSLISFNRVTDQLVIQNQEQLEQEAKATGLGIFERLTLLEAEMQLVDTQFSEVENASASVLTAAQRDRMNEKFKTLGWVNDVGTYAPFLEPVDRTVSPDIYDRPLQGTGDTVIYSTQDANEVWRIFMVYVAEQTVTEGKVLIAEIYPNYLWSVETLDPSRGVCVLSQGNEVLFCSETVPLALPEFARQFTANSFAGSTEWGETDEPTHLVSYWSIFLGSNFDAQDWTSLVSFPRQDVLSPVTNFQNTFLIITDIDSGDEFSDLADSFNTMGSKLADQFHSLQTVAEIDRLILSSQDASNIVQAVLVRINEIIECDQIAISAQNSDGKFDTMYSMTHKSPEVTESSIELARNDIDLLESNRAGFTISKNQGAPDFL